MRPDWRRTALSVSIFGVEGCWLYGVLLLTNLHALNDSLSVPGLMLLYPASVGLNWLLRRAGWHRVLERAASWAGWAAALLLMVKLQLYAGRAWSDTAWLASIPQSIAQIFDGFKPELLILLASIGLWWLGRRLSRMRPGFAIAVGEFQFGLAILVLTFFSASQLKVGMGGTLPTALAFFIFSLTGISIAHAEEGASWLSGSRRHWSMLLLASIGAVVVLGWLITSTLTPDALSVLLNGLKWLWGALMKALAFIASLLPAPEPGEMPTPPPGAGIEGGGENVNPLLLPEALRDKLSLVWAIVMIGLLLFALWRISSQILGWLRRKLAGASEGEVERLPGGFRADLLNLIRFLFVKLVSLLRLVKRRQKVKPVPEIASVRQVYRQMLRWAAAKGYRRALSQTPHEFMDVLAAALPEARLELGFITEQYVRVRYSRSSPDQAELSRLKQTWNTVQKIRVKKA